MPEREKPLCWFTPSPAESPSVVFKLLVYSSACKLRLRKLLILLPELWGKYFIWLIL